MQKPLVGLVALVLLAGCGTHVNPAASLRGATVASAKAKVAKIFNPTGAEIFAQLDANQDGTLTLAEYQALGIFGVDGFTPVPNVPNPTVAQGQAATFQMLDKSHDQALTPKEFENFGVALQAALYFSTPSEEFTTMFPTLDTDHDGALSLAEWQGLGIWGVYGVDAKRAPSLADQQAASFNALDRNHDGALSLAELTF